MKLMFISDIHGSYYYAKKAIDMFEQEKADRLIILGDILYHGPRNDLPEEYAPKKVIPLLNGYKDRIIAVRGNCDAEVDQMVLDFPIRSDYVILEENGYHFFLTHGHIFNEDNLPPLKQNDIFVYGHIHKPVAKYENDIYIINPSSISLPKEGTNSYGVFEDGLFVIKDFDNNIIKEISFNRE